MNERVTIDESSEPTPHDGNIGELLADENLSERVHAELEYIHEALGGDTGITITTIRDLDPEVASEIVFRITD